MLIYLGSRNFFSAIPLHFPLTHSNSVTETLSLDFKKYHLRVEYRIKRAHNSSSHSTSEFNSIHVDSSVLPSISNVLARPEGVDS